MTNIFLVSHFRKHGSNWTRNNIPHFEIFSFWCHQMTFSVQPAVPWDTSLICAMIILVTQNTRISSRGSSVNMPIIHFLTFFSSVKEFKGQTFARKMECKVMKLLLPFCFTPLQWTWCCSSMNYSSFSHSDRTFKWIVIVFFSPQWITNIWLWILFILAAYMLCCTTVFKLQVCMTPWHRCYSLACLWCLALCASIKLVEVCFFCF